MRAENKTIQVTTNVALNMGTLRRFYCLDTTTPTVTVATTAETTVKLIHNIRAKLNALAGLSGSDVNIGTAVTT